MKKKFAVIGFPIEHSLSPLMHEAGYKALGINAEYHRIPLRIDELGQGIDFLKINNYDGWNVTYPLKEHIMPLLDSITAQALAIGAVNTVKAAHGSLEGHNTDGEGFIESLLDKGYNFEGKKVVILGAGGAAKAIAVALANRKAELLILNRTEEKAKKLAGQVLDLGGRADWGVLAAGEWLRYVDLLVPTSAVGMGGEQYPLRLDGINPASCVVDLIYRPPVTLFLAEAADKGCKIINGLEMLLYQGALSWKIWLDIEAPVSVMRNALLEV